MKNDNKKVQEMTLDLLKEFIRICKDNNLTYFVSGGSLIGVMRHKGFIPWDDDIDIVMPRNDYNKFIEIMHKLNNDKIGICDRYTNKEWHYDLCQFINKDVEIEIDLAAEKRKANVWIDVFPLDGLPNKRIKRWFRIKHILFLRYKIQIANIDKQIDCHRKRPWYEKIVIRICSIIKIGRLFNIDKNLDKLEKTLQKSNYYESNYVGNMLGRYREREVVPRRYFGTPTIGVFEKEKVNIPEQSDNLLKCLYGDYMKLPPENERVGHNVRIITKKEKHRL